MHFISIFGRFHFCMLFLGTRSRRYLRRAGFHVKHGKLYRLLALGADAYSGHFSSEVTRSPRSVSVGRGCPDNVGPKSSIFLHFLRRRTYRFVTILVLPLGKNSEGLCDVLIDHNRHHPRCDAGFLDLGSRLRRWPSKIGRASCRERV